LIIFIKIRKGKVRKFLVLSSKGIQPSFVCFKRVALLLLCVLFFCVRALMCTMARLPCQLSPCARRSRSAATDFFREGDSGGKGGLRLDPFRRFEPGVLPGLALPASPPAAAAA
jgi:hypothetical protein